MVYMIAERICKDEVEAYLDYVYEVCQDSIKSPLDKRALEEVYKDFQVNKDDSSDETAVSDK